MAVMNDQRPIYDRGLLLGGAKRNAVLEMWEVERYGTDSYGDADYVSVYGMRPADWYTKGVRLLGRTAVECTRDALADVIGKDVADVAALAPQKTRTLVEIRLPVPATRCIGCCVTCRAPEASGSNRT